MVELIDNCVGCEICKPGCSNKEKYTQVSCDWCGETNSEENIYSYEGKDLCIKCLIEALEADDVVEIVEAEAS